MEKQGRDWFVGVDWASQTHHVLVIDPRGGKLGERGFTHGGEGLAETAVWIGKRTGAAPDAVSVAIEVARGPVVESLMERGFRVHAIDPERLDRFRDRFSPVGAEDVVAAGSASFRAGVAGEPAGTTPSPGRHDTMANW